MEKALSAASILVLSLMSYSFLMRAGKTPLEHHQESASVPEPYVQVTSVKAEPSTIHKSQNPAATIITVQITLRGQAPPNAEAVIEAGSFSSDPPNNELKYENPTRTVSLEKGVTVVKFEAETTPKTFSGKIKVAATLGGATKGINIKDSEPKDLLTELTVSDP